MILFNSIFPKGSPLKDLKVWTRSVKFVNLGNTLLYDTQKELSYKDIVIHSIYDTNTLPASGGNITPSISIEQPWTRVGYSGNEYKQSSITNYTNVLYSANPVEGFTLDTITGKVTCDNNTTDSPKLFEVDVTITMDISGSVKNETVEIIQEKGVKSQTEEIVNDELISTINYGEGLTKIPAKGGEATITTQARQTKTIYTYWNNILTETSEEEQFSDVPATYSKTSGASVFKVNDNKVQITSGRGTLLGADRNATIKASYEELSTTLKCIQEHNYIESIKLAGGSIIYDNTFNESGDTTLTPTITNNTATYIYTSESESTSQPSVTYGTVTRESSFSLEQPINGVIIDSTTGKITISNNDTGSQRSITVIRTETVTWTPKTNYGEKPVSGTIENKYTINQDSVIIQERQVLNSISINPVDTIPASGKEVKLTTYATYTTYKDTYINGVLTSSTEEPYNETIEIIPEYSVTGTGFSIKGTTLIVESRGSEPSDNVRNGIVTATYEGKTDQLIVTQAANGKVKVVKDAIGSFTYYPVSNEGCKKKAIDEMNIELLIEENYLSGEYVNNSRPQPVPITNVDQLQEFLTYYDPVTQTAPVDYWFGIVEPCLEYDETGHGFDVCEVWDQTGAIDWAKNTTGQNRQAKIGLFACTGVENGIRKYECVLESTTIQQEIITYKISNVSLNFTAAEDNITPTIECTKYIDGIPQDETFELTDYILTKVEGSDGFTTDGKKIVVSANTGIERSAKFNISVGTNTINPEYYEIGTLTCTQDEDSIDHYIHNISLSAYPDPIDVSGGSSTITATCNKYAIWVSGNQTGPTSETPTLSKIGSGFTLNGTTLTASKNTSESERYCQVTATCGTGSKTITVTQEGDYIKTYGTPTISIGEGMTAKGGEATVTASVINTYASGDEKEGTVTLEITSNGNNRFSLSGNTLRHGNMGTTTSESVTVTAYNADNRSKKASATKDITNSVEKSTVTKIELSEFSYPEEATTSAGYSINPTIGDVTVSLQDTYQSGSTGSTYSVSNVTDYTKKFAIGSIQYFSIDTSSGKCTTKSVNSGSSRRSANVMLTITLTGDYQGTASFSTTIYQAATPSYKATIYYTPPSDSEGWIITNSTTTPTCGTGFAEWGNYRVMNFRAGYPLSVVDYQGNIGNVAIGSEAYVYVYVDGQWNQVGQFTHRNENYTVYI